MIGEVDGRAVGGVLEPGPVGSVAAGVGVGPSATIGPLGPGVTGADPDGTASFEADGSLDAGGSAEAVGGSLGAEGVGDAPMGGDALGPAGRDGAGEVTANPRSGVGATTPAVNATVARMRFRSPMATTRRAR